MCEKLLLARRKPGPQAMGAQLRLPPGEPCHEGESLLRRWDTSVTWVAGNPDAWSRSSRQMCGFLTRSSSHVVFQWSSRLSHQRDRKYLAVPTAPQTLWGSPSGSRTEVTPTWSPDLPNVDYYVVLVLSVWRGNLGCLLRADSRVGSRRMFPGSASTPEYMVHATCRAADGPGIPWASHTAP